MLVALVALVLGIYALVDCLRQTGSHVRGLPLGVWVALIVLLPVVGPVTWLLAGRIGDHPAGRRAPSSPSPAPRGPDDDDDFLRSLDRKDRGDLGASDPTGPGGPAGPVSRSRRRSGCPGRRR